MRILFVDMDYFYAACEEVRHPELKGKPLLVSSPGGKSRGVVESCNYEARRLGIKSAMPVMDALKIKPDIQCVQADHDYYDEQSGRIMAFLKTFTTRMEVISVDEAALDIGSMGHDDESMLANKIKDGIFNEVGLPCTIGISKGKILAKMVCDSAKPNGIKILEDDEIRGFLWSRSVEDIPGVGRKTAERLGKRGIRTIGDLSRVNPVVLRDAVGSFSKELHDLASGIDNSVIIEHCETLSIGRERTLENPTSDIDRASDTLKALVGEVMDDLDKHQFLLKTITAKVKYTDFSDRIHSKSLSHPTDSRDVLLREATSLLKDLMSSKKARKIGVRVSSFTGKSKQKKLF
jgi:nucleotidyltransferase/DNA polymerase involved in DNA repair